MLNTKYIIYNPDAPPLVNQNALGNAWFVEKPVMVENANKEISAINYFNPSKEAIIDNVFKDQITKSSYPVLENEKIELVSYKPNELVYKYSARERNWLYFQKYIILQDGRVILTEKKVNISGLIMFSEEWLFRPEIMK